MADASALCSALLLPSMAAFFMSLSALDLFTIGVGPSSSHTVGPMRAARRFIDGLANRRGLVSRVRCDLYGSLAATGKGHGTDTAVMMGFLGMDPETVDVDEIPIRVEEIRRAQKLQMPWGDVLPFNPRTDLLFKRLKPLPLHPNGMHFQALDVANG
ncbi:MAG: serine dehydratase beta chain, partial [Verrucomicrobiales bacterium]